MSEFLYIYRMAQPAEKPSPEQMQQRMQKWMMWMKGLEANGHIKERGHPLEAGGKVVRGSHKTVMDGPYAETKDIVGGYSLIEAKDLAEAAELSKGCPILEGGGAVEVRAIMQMNM
jgi:hypothetical protein